MALSAWCKLQCAHIAMCLAFSYGFRLVATAVDSILETVLGTATTVITVLTNSPPAGGALAVTPANGTELETVFNIAASGWTDDAGDLPLSYSFSRLPGRFPVSVPQLWFPTAVTDAAGDVLDFQALSGALSVGSLATMLPAGDLVDGGATTVQVLVSDAFGAVSSVASVVNVTLNTTGLPIDVPSLDDVVTTVVPTVVPAGTPKLSSGAWYANPSADFTLGSTVVVNETESSSSSRRLVLSGTPVLSYMWSVDGGALNLSAPGVVSGSLVGDMLVIRAGVLSPGER